MGRLVAAVSDYNGPGRVLKIPPGMTGEELAKWLRESGAASKPRAFAGSQAKSRARGRQRRWTAYAERKKNPA